MSIIRHPGVVPDDYSESEHLHHFDRYFSLDLDHTQSPLFDPIRVNIHDPAQSFREILSNYVNLGLQTGVGGQLEMVSQQMAQVFLASPATGV